ncbi:hypothetical protein SynMVIR181_02986 [Synechococcus sp. MVIR-18-1]|nr:hypothetical protein SynMVIR181_02986 [Synechococcus sp. MVIR-18-1]
MTVLELICIAVLLGSDVADDSMMCSSVELLIFRFRQAGMAKTLSIAIL